MSHRHLNQDERYQIQALNRTGRTQQQIAEQLGRSGSTICRELKRGTGGCGYRAQQAQVFAIERAAGSRNARVIEHQMWSEVRRRIEQQNSPEQIAGLLEISHETIYQYIYADKENGGMLWTVSVQPPHLAKAITKC